MGRQGAFGDRREFVVALVFAVVLLVAACTSDADDSAVASEPTATPASIATPVPAATTPPEPTPSATSATATPEPSATPTPVASLGRLPAARPIGDRVPAELGTYVIAKPGAGFPTEDGTRIVPVYDVPDGAPRALLDQNEIDGVQLTYPLANPSVFGQPLVLRVLSGGPTSDWLLVQAPVRPHRQYVWVRTEDFTFGKSNLRIEVDLGRDARFALFDGETELITNPAVYGRESRPTVLHDTYVEQAFDASVLSPAYGTYILTIASYSQALGTFGGGGLPGQSIHGTNQPDLVGQRVSSGGIRLPNEVIEFVYAQPGIIGASVIIYDSTGIGRDAAIAVQRNQRWTAASTVALRPDELPPVPVPSYS